LANVFDGSFLLPYAEEAATYIESLAKTVDRIVLSHIHLDHWSGLLVVIAHAHFVPPDPTAWPGCPLVGSTAFTTGTHDIVNSCGGQSLDPRAISKQRHERDE
jgi:glyoxylase-like metal-dependent hydrolase (beta-lactamase superfamily II)